MTEAQGVTAKISHRASAEVDERFRAVARYDVSDLPVAAPRRLLEAPATGYLMDLITGMMAIGKLGPTGSFTQVAAPRQLEDWFVETGGLRKRLEIIAAVADIFAALHSRGLVYGDLNAGNVLVSELPNRSRVYLIDLDNLAATDDEPQRYWTPDFAAPEFQATGATHETDLFSIAVLAWALLTTKNPYYGKKLDQEAPENLQEAPWSTLAPFVDDDQDRSNLAVGAFNRGRVLAPRLRRSLTSTLAHPRLDGAKALRPSAGELALTARSAALALRECPCGWTDYAPARDCYRCDAPAKASTVRVFAETAPGSWRPWQRAPILALADDQALPLDRLSLGLTGPSRDTAVLLEQSSGHLSATSHCDEVTVRPACKPGDPIRLERHARSTLLLAATT